MTSPSAQHPRQAAGVREYPMGVELLLYPPGGESAHALSPSARIVWELCDGTRTLEQMCDELAPDVGRPAADLMADVKQAIERFTELGLLARD